MIFHRKPSSHRKPRQPVVGGSTARTAVTLAMAGAVSATVLTETGQAASRTSPEQVREQIEDLYQQAEAATQKYDGVTSRAEGLRKRLENLQGQLARRTQQVEETRDRLGAVAAEQYRTGGQDPALQLLLSSEPGQYLEDAGLLERAGSAQSTTLHRLTTQQRGEETLRAEARQELTALTASKRELAADKRVVDGKLGAARRLLNRLTARQRAAVRASDPAGEGGSPGGAATAKAPNARAAEVVAFAYAQLGKPYIWGATGPAGFDCSGLAQAAWAAAGVALPRTTYSQINAGTRVPQSRLEPGDLVFYYAGVSHVGIYVGDGLIIHAPHPGAPVRVAPVGEMPFAGATRPA